MAPDRTPGDFGRKLRAARERKGVSLRQIASATKISVSALEALERNDISRLPGGLFSRAFVRSYAIEVGLDPETTIQEFIAQFRSDSVTAGHPTSDPIEDHEAIESDRRMATTILRLLLISVPVGIAVIYLGTAGRRFLRSEAPPKAPPPATESVAPAPPPVETPAPNPDVSTPAVPTHAAPTPAVPTPSTSAATVAATDEHLTVGLTVTRPCWVSATVDGQKKLERLLQPGDPQTLDVTRELVLTAGDAAAITMTLNGAETKPFGEAGKVVTRRVNLTNFKEFVLPR